MTRARSRLPDPEVAALELDLVPEAETGVRRAERDALAGTGQRLGVGLHVTREVKQTAGAASMWVTTSISVTLSRRGRT